MEREAKTKMSKDFYFKPDNVRIGTDFRDPKGKWFIQFNYKNCGISFEISDRFKKQIVNTIVNDKDYLFGMILKDETWGEYFK